MTDFGNLVPDLAELIGVQPSTLVLLIFIVTTVANAGARLIPNDAVGFWGWVRKICAFIGVHVSSRVAGGVTMNDIAAAALKTPSIGSKIVATTGIAAASVSQGALATDNTQALKP